MTVFRSLPIHCGPTAVGLLDHLPVRLVAEAAALYHDALGDKLIPIYGSGQRARLALAQGFNRHMCICALDTDQLVGILGIQTAAGGFMDVSWRVLRPFYGFFGGLWRMALLAILHHVPLSEEAYIDGVAVAQEYRGRGIGSSLIAALESWALDKGLSCVSLEVVNTNQRANSLYRHLGFEAVRVQTVWPFNTLFGFQSSTVMLKKLN
jgi:ribosomal protein S18 acetylase RimI-like enzyme